MEKIIATALIAQAAILFVIMLQLGSIASQAYTIDVWAHRVWQVAKPYAEKMTQCR